MKKLFLVLLLASFAPIAFGQSIPNLLEIEDLIHKQDIEMDIYDRIYESGENLSAQVNRYFVYYEQIANAYLIGIGHPEYTYLNDEEERAHVNRIQVGVGVRVLCKLKALAHNGNLTQNDLDRAVKYNNAIEDGLKQLQQLYEQWEAERSIDEKTDSLTRELSKIIKTWKL